MLARGVEERRKELSIRAALGAAFWMARLIQARLFGVTPSDPTSMAVAVTIVAGVALASSLVPARRAVRIDVVKELR